MTLIEMGAEAVVIWLSIFVGMRWHGRILARRLPKPPPVPDLTCGCGHVLAFHDPASGRCIHVSTWTDYVRTYNSKGEVKDKTPVRLTEKCICAQYTGELTADFYARSIMRGEQGEIGA